jgi:hypothetical protein
MSSTGRSWFPPLRNGCCGAPCACRAVAPMKAFVLGGHDWAEFAFQLGRGVLQVRQYDEYWAFPPRPRPQFRKTIPHYDPRTSAWGLSTHGGDRRHTRGGGQPITSLASRITRSLHSSSPTPATQLASVVRHRAVVSARRRRPMLRRSSQSKTSSSTYSHDAIASTYALCLWSPFVRLNEHGADAMDTERLPQSGARHPGSSSVL